MDDERDDDPGEDVSTEDGAKVVRFTSDHAAVLNPLPRTPEPHKNVGDDGDDEKRPGTRHNELVQRPVGVVEKIAIHFGNTIVPHLEYHRLTHGRFALPGPDSRPT
jgi:hypothetical protein